MLSSKLVDMYADGRMAFWCPGCEEAHSVYVHGTGHPVWTWNGNTEKPTFGPSILVRGGISDRNPGGICHSFVRDGQIQFLNDCTHPLAGKTVPIPDLPDFMRED